jgi:protein ImuB
MRDPVTLAVVATETPELHARLLSTLHAALPRVGVLGPGVFACDLAGTEELLGAPKRVARGILARCARVGARASVGIAPTPFVARVVAERTPPGEVRAVDDARAFLASLPLEVLPVDEKVHEELRLLGLRRVGEFAELPRGSVFDRFGSAVARAHALARGEFGDMVRASTPPRRIRARRAWDDAIASREQLVFALRVVVDEISAALARDGLAALRLELRLDREDAGPLRIERAVLPPTREAAALLRSLRWALEERDELGLVTGCAIEVPEVEAARGRQIGLFAPDGARQEEAIATARYLRAKLGKSAVLRARVANEDARLPERATEWVEVIA